MKEYLTDIEIEKIEQFCKDETLYEAVRKVVLAGIYSHGTLQKGTKPNPLINGALSLVSLSTTNPIPDEVIGQQLRAQWAGLNAMENAFTQLKTIKKEDKSVETPYNEAI